MIRTLADITLVPVALLGGGEEMRAQLFEELKGRYLTVVFADDSGNPTYEIAWLRRAELYPFDGSLWRLSLRLQHKGRRRGFGIDLDFPTEPCIVMKGERALDFDALDLSPGTWTVISDYCQRVAGDKRMLLDTTEAAIASHRERHCPADVMVQR